MEPMRTGIIGCGKLAQKRHAENLAALDEIDLVGFCDTVQDNADAFNEQFTGGEGRVYLHHERMFEELDLDLVCICLPPFAHSNEVELACNHGVHFLIEKPIALSLELGRAMVEHVGRSGVKSQVGFMMRHGEAVQRLAAYVRDANARGRGFMLGTYFCNSLHRPWWRDRGRSGGQLVEQVIHVLDLARLLFGEPISVYSAQDNLFHRDLADYTIEDASGTVIRFGSGSLAVIAASNGAIPNRWDSEIRVCLPGLTVDLHDANHGVFHDTGEKHTATTTVSSEKDVFLAETMDLLAAIRADRPTMAPIEEGYRSLRLALATTRSAELGVPVDIPHDM